MMKRILRKERARALGVGLSLWSAACATEEIQLESMEVFSSLQAPELAGTDVRSRACLGFVNTVSEEYEVRLNGQPLRYSEEDQIVRVGKAEKHAFCVLEGDFNVSLVVHGTTLAQTGTLSLHGRSQHMFVIHGSRQAPTLRAAEVDMSSASPDFDLRRMRVTNLARDQRPVELVYYDWEKNEVARGPRIAYGDTWSGTLPENADYWAYSPDDPLKKVIPRSGLGSLTPWQEICREPAPQGLVLTASEPDSGDIESFGTWHDELYFQAQATCTVKEDRCPSCPLPWE